MKKLFIFICLQGIVLSLFGQTDYLLLTRNRMLFKTTIKIPEGRMVNIKPVISDRETLIGKLEILNDNVIIAGGDTLLVNNIKKIRVKNTASNVTGGLLTVTGLTCIISGGGLVGAILPLDPESYLAIFQLFGVMLGASVIVGGIIITAVGISTLVIGRSYKINERFAYSIKVVHDQILTPSGDKLANRQLKY